MPAVRASHASTPRPLVKSAHGTRAQRCPRGGRRTGDQRGPLRQSHWRLARDIDCVESLTRVDAYDRGTNSLRDTLAVPTQAQRRALDEKDPAPPMRPQREDARTHRGGASNREHASGGGGGQENRTSKHRQNERSGGRQVPRSARVEPGRVRVRADGAAQTARPKSMRRAVLSGRASACWFGHQSLSSLRCESGLTTVPGAHRMELALVIRDL